MRWQTYYIRVELIENIRAYAYRERKGQIVPNATGILCCPEMAGLAESWREPLGESGLQVPNCQSIYIARHGETKWNLERRLQGVLDSPLTDAGVKQAKTLARFFASFPIQALFTSMLGRAAMTASIIGRKINLTPILCEEIRECSFGDLAGLTAAEINERYPELKAKKAWQRWEYRFPGGESYQDVFKRVSSFVEQRLNACAGEVILVVAHEMVNRTLIGALTDLPPTTIMGVKQPHCVVYRREIEFKQETVSYRDVSQCNTDWQYQLLMR